MMWDLGGIKIQLLQKQKSIEIFEICAEKIGLGPGLHMHLNMEESFYVLEGSVAFTLEESQFVGKKNTSLSVPRNTKHSWKTLEKNTKMLLIFTPAQNQEGYFAELEKFQKQGKSWEEAIASLSEKFDNIPVIDFTKS